MAVSRCMVVLLALASGGCASALTDEMATTMEATREANVRAMHGLADSAERLPVTLDRMNALLLRADEASADMRQAQRSLTDEVAHVTSSTALAIARLSELVGTLDRVALATHGVLTRVDEVAAGIQERAPGLREDEARAVRALADLAESSARTGEQVSGVARSVNRLATQLEPEWAKGAKTTTLLLEDVRKLTSRVASEEAAKGALAVNALAGALGAAIMVALVVLVRALFRRAVEKEVAARTQR